MSDILQEVPQRRGIKRIIMCRYVSQFITLIAQHNPVLEGYTGALGRNLCQDLLAQVSSPLIPRSAVSRLIMLMLNFDQSQTYLGSAM